MTDWRYWITADGKVKDCDTREDAIEAALDDQSWKGWSGVVVEVEPLDEGREGE